MDVPIRALAQTRHAVRARKVGMLGAYMHEWRRSPPNDRVVARYEWARLYAVQVNTGADLTPLLDELNKVITGTVPARKLADMIEQELVHTCERAQFNAMLDRGVMDRAKARAINYHSVKIAMHGHMMRLFGVVS